MSALREAMLVTERACLVAAIKKAKNKKECAALLGISYRCLENRAAFHRLTLPFDPRWTLKGTLALPYLFEVPTIKVRRGSRDAHLRHDRSHFAFYFEGGGSWRENISLAISRLDPRLQNLLPGKSCTITREDCTQSLHTIELSSYGWFLR